MISKDDVKKTAQLARLHLEEAEVEQYADQLHQVLKHFEAIQEVFTEDVEPMYSPALESGELRADIVEEFKGKDQVVKNAPDLQGNLFRVPPVV